MTQDALRERVRSAWTPSSRAQVIENYDAALDALCASEYARGRVEGMQNGGVLCWRNIRGDSVLRCDDDEAEVPRDQWCLGCENRYALTEAEQALRALEDV